MTVTESRKDKANPVQPPLFQSAAIMMLHIKFDQHWPADLRDIQVSSELRQNDRTTPEGQGKSSIAPTFSKQGYKDKQ